MNCITSWSSKPVPGPFVFPLFLVDLDKKYRNEIEIEKNNSVTYMEYVFFSNLGCPERRGNHSLTSKCRFKKLKSMTCVMSFTGRPVPFPFLFPLFLADVDKNYKNEIDMETQ